MFASLPRVWCAKCCVCGIAIRSCGSPLLAASPPHWRCLHFADISSKTQEPNVSVTVQSNSNSGESFCQKPFFLKIILAQKATWSAVFPPHWLLFRLMGCRWLMARENVFCYHNSFKKVFFEKKRLSEGPNFFLCKIGQNGKVIQKNMIMARTTSQQKDLINALMEFFWKF